ncbi:thioredoxin-like protein [Aaosphaeria arxii CBS 175.79]|uniref:Thioredoxin-like protein n=1 Tax=Aaosphaeria arxii CBS 175.79 TaxID=1450172 RepID=A0A6A5X6N5_9PLEO|nr:thioredoxin-like protein [Aaosphaeria arxii CBS 175.79]KAF2008507.1 thioredoxin-like protein [Aaosphaeria arxii CBS 175.79]
MTNFDIKIVSDTVCPWCYVGKKRLEKGIEAYKAKHPESNDTFTTTWFPFYLDPTAPRQSVEKRERYIEKFGPARVDMMFDRLAQLGKLEGIDFKFGGRTGNTRDSHRLIQLGKTKGPERQTRVIEELFAAYFENEKDITNEDVLVQAGVKAGLDEAEARAWLKEGKGGPQVDKEVQDAYEQNISGVPNFTLNDRFEIGGAQEPAAFVQLFERIKNQDKGSAPAAGSAPQC